MACIRFLRSFCLEQSRRQRKAALWPMEGTPPVSPCVPLCAILLAKASVYPLSPVKANVGHLREKLKSGWGIKFMVVALPDFLPLLMLRVHREPGNVCI